MGTLGSAKNYCKREVMCFKISSWEKWLKRSTVSFSRVHKVFSLSLTKNILSRESYKRLSILLSGNGKILLKFQISLILKIFLDFIDQWPPLLLLGSIYHLLNIARYFANHTFERVPQWAQYSAILPGLFGLKYCNIPLRAPASPRAGLDIYNFNIQPRQLPPRPEDSDEDAFFNNFFSISKLWWGWFSQSKS